MVVRWMRATGVSGAVRVVFAAGVQGIGGAPRPSAGRNEAAPGGLPAARRRGLAHGRRPSRDLRQAWRRRPPHLQALRFGLWPRRRRVARQRAPRSARCLEGQACYGSVSNLKCSPCQHVERRGPLTPSPNSAGGAISCLAGGCGALALGGRRAWQRRCGPTGTRSRRDRGPRLPLGQPRQRRRSSRQRGP